MKVLFVCRSNVGRSQMAMEFFRQFGAGDTASAGTAVEKPGQKLKERESATKAVVVMKELGIDMSENRRTQLTPTMPAGFDKIVVMAETEALPSWLHGNPKVEIWDIEDASGKTVEQARKIRDQIKAHVAELVGRTRKVRQARTPD
jgi:arsenate reductase